MLGLSIPTTFYTHAAVAVVAAALASAGTYKAMDNAHQAEAAQRLQAERAADQAAQTDAKQQRQFNDTAAGRHAAQLAAISTKLGDARAHIATLSSRPCLSRATVGLLNTINASPPRLGVRTPAGGFAGAPPAPAPDTADDAAGGYATERDTAEAIATCRARYAEVAGQVNAILDIEDAREKQGEK